MQYIFSIFFILLKFIRHHEINTLVNLGKIPITTHSDSGSSGLGFMNTFDTLNKYDASISINEFNSPCEDNYTKSVVITFDKKNKFSIFSYRTDEIEKQNNNALDVFKIN